MADMNRNQCDRIVRKIFNMLSSEGLSLEQGMRILFVAYICIAIEKRWGQKDFDESLEEISRIYQIELTNHILNENQD